MTEYLLVRMRSNAGANFLSDASVLLHGKSFDSILSSIINRVNDWFKLCLTKQIGWDWRGKARKTERTLTSSRIFAHSPTKKKIPVSIPRRGTNPVFVIQEAHMAFLVKPIPTCGANCCVNLLWVRRQNTHCNLLYHIQLGVKQRVHPDYVLPVKGWIYIFDFIIFGKHLVRWNGKQRKKKRKKQVRTSLASLPDEKKKTRSTCCSGISCW